MKTLLYITTTIYLLSMTGNCLAQQETTSPPLAVPSIISRDANSRVWERIEYVPRPNGKLIPKKHHYTEMATGLCYQKNGQWLDSQEQINIQPDGSAEAIQGQHQAYFPADIYDGLIKLVTPDGLELQSQPIALSYDNGTNTVIIAVLTNSVGELISSNQVLYPHAFVGIDADLLYTYRKSGFEQDVIFRGQPQAPEQFGLNSSQTRLQLLTEFFDPSSPVQSPGLLNSQDQMQDTTLGFGTMKMGHGKAFLIGRSGKEQLDAVPVYKSWVEINGRTLLIEELPYERISSQLSTLPPVTGASSAGSLLRKVSNRRLLPPLRSVTASTKTIQLAKADYEQQPGMILDYNELDPEQTNFTFQGDTTYYVSGECGFSETTTFEGGTVIKIGSAMMTINDGGRIVCKTGPYRPAILTSISDDQVGEIISGSTGTPDFQDNFIDMSIYGTNCAFHDMHFRYVAYAIIENDEPGSFSLKNCQFLNVATALIGYNIYLYNDLIGCSPSEAAEISAYESPEILLDGNLVAENVTADSGYSFIQADNPGETMTLTNCLITSQMLTNANVGATLHTNGVVYLPSPSVPVYQVVGGGNYYLTNNSPGRGVGTANIDSGLLADLAHKTTQPPIVYSNITFTTNVVLGPHAIRDTNALDVGYHYDPIDWAFGGCNANSNMTFTAGTAVGWFRTSSGWSFSVGNFTGHAIHLGERMTAAFQGTATQPDYFVRCNVVQDSPFNNLDDGVGPGGITAWTNQFLEDVTRAAIVQAQFTRCSMLAGDTADGYFADDWGYMTVRARNCEFWGGQEIGFVLTCDLTNCLFDRVVQCGQVEGWPGNEFILKNCTWHGGQFVIRRGNGSLGFDPDVPVRVRNCAFDGTSISTSDSDNGNTNLTDYDYNAFLTNADQTDPAGSHDVIVTDTNGFNWQTNWFGNFYLPANSLLINAGSLTADKVGLYHFTTQTNQVPETNSIVDIGYHYVATDQYGSPLDNNGDGIPDYIEDPSGDGSGNWDTSLLLNVIITQPRNGSVLP